MPYEPSKKGTLLVPSGSFRNPHALHLHVIITEACRNGQHLLLSISSIREGIYYDRTCVIDADEHNFIQHPSYVVYRKPRQDRTDKIKKFVSLGYFQPREPVCDQLFERICEGIDESPFIPRWAKAYYQENGN